MSKYIFFGSGLLFSHKNNFWSLILEFRLILFMMIELKNLCLDIHEGKLEFDLHIYTWPASKICLQRPLSGLI